jgi:hypothetical protein
MIVCCVVRGIAHIRGPGGKTTAACASVTEVNGSYTSTLTYEGEVTDGSKTAVMDVIGFLCVSLGSSTVQVADAHAQRLL